ncbi:MAG: LLM class flavin-dependent oxidoreductase, partial [Chloroflexota bacterium]|nr:LLM class flavin-dependent oxidoreductase [Chloroflexota bacterium]
VPDHLLFRNAGHVVVSAGETRGNWEAFTLLGALAASTKRVTLGPFVACTSFRNPALLAKMADSLDHVSNGRLLLGLGAGWHEPEYAAYGYEFDHLASRFEEALRIIVPLLKGEHVTFKGAYYAVDDCVLHPHSPRPDGPPIWIGAKGPRMLRLVARHADAYNTLMHATPETLVEPFAKLDQACREVGRDPATILKTAAGFVALPGAEDDPGGLPEVRIQGTPEQVAEQLAALHDAGVRHYTCFTSPVGPRGVELLGRAIEVLRKSGR